MHELGIAESALSLALDRARAEGAARITHIVIRIGALSGVDPESLRFAFTTILPGTPAEGATVQIYEVPAVARCPHCHEDFALEDRLFCPCPKCNRFSAEITQGRELDLVRLELC